MCFLVIGVAHESLERVEVRIGQVGLLFLENAVFHGIEFAVDNFSILIEESSLF